MHNLREAFVSSKKMDYSTPILFFDALNSVFGFETDLAASPENALCPKYYTESEDALTKEWRGVCWLNPPYGRALPRFVAKASSEAMQKNTTIVMLIPARPDRLWWEKYIWRGDLIAASVDLCFVRGRLKFGEEVNQAPFPSAVVIFSRNGMDEQTQKQLGELDIGNWIWQNIYGCRVVR
jgi:phage N-6-adenine-methyltransferase